MGMITEGGEVRAASYVVDSELLLCFVEKLLFFVIYSF